MSRRTYGRNAFESNLDGAITAGATSLTLDSAAGLTAPGYLVLEPEVAAKREFIKFTGISTNTLTGLSRGLDGSTAGAQAHGSGAVVRSVFMGQYLADIFSDIEDLEAADAAHIGGTDTSDHPEATPSVRGFLSATDKTKLDSVESGALAQTSIESLFDSRLATKDLTDLVSALHTDLTALDEDELVAIEEMASATSFHSSSVWTTLITREITLPAHWLTYHLEVDAHINYYARVESVGGVGYFTQVSFSVLVEGVSGAIQPSIADDYTTFDIQGKAIGNSPHLPFASTSPLVVATTTATPEIVFRAQAGDVFDFPEARNAFMRIRARRVT